MRIGIMAPYADMFASVAAELVAYDRAGLDIAAIPEAYSFDAVSQLGYLAAKTERMQLRSAIMQIYTRTPTLTAMTAAGLDYVSGGRFELGIGASGPQVVEGFHGVPYTQPLARTKEIVEICRAVWRRERVQHQGKQYQIPLPPERGTGLGKPLKIINKPVRERIPITIAAIGPKNVALAAEIAEGWQPIFYHPERAKAAWGDALAEGLSRRPADLGPLDITVVAAFAITDDPDPLIDRVRPDLALYIGGMGARGRNFYHDLAQRYGYGEAADAIQDDAVAAVPVELARAVSLIGPEEWLRDQLAALAAAGVTTLLVKSLAPTNDDRLRQVLRLRELAG
jgi:F420-dependent oxidoreductase-like protein